MVVGDEVGVEVAVVVGDEVGVVDDDAAGSVVGLEAVGGEDVAPLPVGAALGAGVVPDSAVGANPDPPVDDPVDPDVVDPDEPLSVPVEAGPVVAGVVDTPKREVGDDAADAPPAPLDTDVDDPEAAEPGATDPGVAPVCAVVDCEDGLPVPVVAPVLSELGAAAPEAAPITAVTASKPSEPEMSRLTAVQRGTGLPAPGLVPAT